MGCSVQNAVPRVCDAVNRPAICFGRECYAGWTRPALSCARDTSAQKGRDLQLRATDDRRHELGLLMRNATRPV